MIKKILFAIAFSFAAVPAFAACTDPIAITPGGGGSANMSVKTGADGNCQSNIDADTSSVLYGALTAAVPVQKNGSPAALTGQTPGTAQTGTQVNGDVGLQAVGNTSVASCVSNYGTSPGTVNCPGVNAAITQLPGTTYNTVAASQTTQALTGGGGGATGDLLNFCMVIPTSTSPGVVTILDNATTIVAFPGGASSISNLVPFMLSVGSKSTSGAWKVTTGANLSVVCNGKFT